MKNICLKFLFYISLFLMLSFFVLYYETYSVYIKSSIYNKESLDVFVDNSNTDTNTYTYNKSNIENYTYTTKTIYLTFDDGPNKKYTPLLLDYLKSKNIKATFFLIGQNIEGKEDIVKRMYDEGHTIGIHGYSHKLLSKLSEKRAIYEIEKTSDLIENITGVTPKYIRPPYGSINNKVRKIVQDKSLDIVLWNVDSLDWKYRNTDKIYNKIISKVKNNSVILMHDSFFSSLEAVKKIIDKLESEDFVFKCIK